MFDLETDGVVARLTLNRPEARNAIPMTGWSVLADRAEQAAATARIVVLAARGNTFCAGADVKQFIAFRSNPSAAAEFRLAMRDGLDRIAALPVPTVALIEGGCYGAGVALAMACDIRIAGPSARFAITPAKLGIGYPQEDISRLVALVSAGAAARLLLSAEPIDAEEALRIGLVQQGSEKVIASIAAHDRASLAMLKRGLALAARGIRSDAAQDQQFDALLAGDAPASPVEDL